MHMNTHRHMLTYTHSYRYMHMHIPHTYIHIHTFTHKYTHTHRHTHTHIYTCIHHTHIYTFTHTHTHIHIHTHTYVQTHMTDHVPPVPALLCSLSDWATWISYPWLRQPQGFKRTQYTDDRKPLKQITWCPKEVKDSVSRKEKMIASQSCNPPTPCHSVLLLSFLA